MRPGPKLVIVHTAAWPTETAPALVAERSAFIGGIIAAAGAQ